MGPLLCRQLAELGIGPDVRAPGRRHPRPSRPRDGHAACCARCFPASRSWPPRRPRPDAGDGEGGRLLPPDRSRSSTGALAKAGTIAAEPAAAAAGREPHRRRPDRAGGRHDRRRRHRVDRARDARPQRLQHQPPRAGAPRAHHLRRHAATTCPAAKTWWPNYFTGYAAYLRSLERLAGLEAEVLCLSHNGAIARAPRRSAAYFAGAIAATRAVPRADRRRGQGRQGGPADRRDAGRRDPPAGAAAAAGFLPEELRTLVKQSLRHEGIAVEK